MHATARFSGHYGDELGFHAPTPPTRQTQGPTRYGGVRVSVYGDLGRPTYVHFHGGAWLMRYPEMDDFWCRYLAARPASPW